MKKVIEGKTKAHLGRIASDSWMTLNALCVMGLSEFLKSKQEAV